MSSRNAYTASTPEYATFSRSNTAETPQDAVASEPPTPEELVNDSAQQTGRWRAKYLVVGEVLKSNVGLLLVTASQAFFSLMNVFVKKLNSIDPPVSTFELIAVRMIITYVFSMAYMIYAKVPDPFLGPKGVRLLLVFRGSSGFFGLLGIYYSLQYLSLSDATVLTFLAPLCTGICGAIFLKERYTAREAFASIFSLFGVVLIARPAFLFGDVNTIHTLSTDPNVAQLASETVTSEQRLIAVGVSLIGVLGATGAYTSITAIGKRAHPLHAMTSFSSQCVIVAVIAMIIQKTPIVVPTEVEWLALLILIGVFGFIAQVLLTMGLQRETAGRASTAVYTQVVFAAVLERIFFQTTPSILSVIGTVIIITAALYVALTKTQTKKNKSILRLSGVPEGALEEGLLDGLLAGHVEEQGLKGTPGDSDRSREVCAAQKTRSLDSQEDELEETTALPLHEGSEDTKAPI
ncbi:hypothetical protein FPV67DRAFT_238487 [Lyophyllum atratum]|nr:hypothetical protein FPV67DRAFT_238487 [Lyophyllum atratum]